MEKIIKPKTGLKGCFTIPGDKSISHRAVMLGAISLGDTEIEGFLTGNDCLSTISCFQKLGIEIIVDSNKVIVKGKGLNGLTKPTEILDVGNSGTTLRLISGLLSAQNFECEITGDSSIQKRPMDRVAIPLRLMNADIQGNGDDHIYAPIKIKGKQLKGIHYTLPVASAQVKSSILLASLFAQGDTIITEPETTRDHSEIMLNYLGADIEHHGKEIISHPVKELYGKKIKIPGDISSAAYFIVAGLISPNSNIKLLNVGINPTRTGIIMALKSMGGDIQIKNSRSLGGELTADIEVTSSQLQGITIGGDTIPKLIDEIPVLAVAACFAKGTTIIKNAEELKVKESNRIKTMVTELKKLGADIEETNDGMIINGGNLLHGAVTESYHDHRIAMSLSIAALCCSSEVTINNAQCVDISFPNFYDYIATL